MIEYKWEVTHLFKNSLGVVTRVYWILTGTDTETDESVSLQGSFPLEPIEDSAEDFISYPNLTEETVIHWLENNRDSLSKKIIVERALRYEEPDEELTESLPWSK